MFMVSRRYTINTKSLLGIYSLDLNRPLQVVMYSDDCEELKKELAEFMQAEKASVHASNQ